MKLYVCCLNLLMALMILPTNAYSTTIMEEKAEAIIERADFIVSATVIDITARLENDVPFEYITIKVKEIHKQDGAIEILEGDELPIRLMGGEVDGKKLVIEGRPQFVKDEDVLVALKLAESGFFYVAGNVQGLYHVAGDKLINDTAETNAMFVRRGDKGQVSFEAPVVEQKTISQMKAMIKKVAEESTR